VPRTRAGQNPATAPHRLAAGPSLFPASSASPGWPRAGKGRAMITGVLFFMLVLLALLLVLFIYQIATTPLTAVDAPTLVRSAAAPPAEAPALSATRPRVPASHAAPGPAPGTSPGRPLAGRGLGARRPWRPPAWPPSSSADGCSCASPLARSPAPARRSRSARRGWCCSPAPAGRRRHRRGRPCVCRHRDRPRLALACARSRRMLAVGLLGGGVAFAREQLPGMWRACDGRRSLGAWWRVCGHVFVWLGVLVHLDGRFRAAVRG
jgi:hypothetical protein